MGFSAGLTYQYIINPNISLCTSLTFEQNSTTEEVYYQYYNGPITVTETSTVYSDYNYIIVPLLGKFTMGKSSKLYIAAGPYFGYLPKIPQGTGKLGTGDLVVQSYNYNFGISTGFGVDVPVRDRFFITLELRNNLELTRLTYDGVYKLTSTVFLLGVNYILGK